MTASSALPPIAGLLVQPVLAQALGLEGRGQLAAALAPAVLLQSAATLGLPEALTFYLAKHPRITRPALVWASALSSALGALGLLLAFVLLPFLSAGDAALGDLILLAIVLTIPALAVGAMRGAASGRQMWGVVAQERVVGVLLRTVGFVTLAALGQLTVLTAVLVSVLSLVAGGLVYWPLLRRPEPDPDERDPDGSTVRLLLSFGSRIWLGAVASIVLGRIAHVLMAPLSNVEQLGLYVVASTVADLPLIVAVAIRDALYGVNSRTTDAAQLTATVRLTLLVGASGSLVMGLTLPLWIGLLFGEAFVAATVPTYMLMVSAVICIPGLIAASGVSAWGRPGLRSIGLLVTLVVNLGVFVLLVPTTGVYGACWTSLASNVVMTGFMVVAASRVMQVPARDFLLVRGADVVFAWRQVSRLLRRPSRGRHAAR